jgi:predicted oxidoreductase (fatty acid repression mutant protein)
MQKKFPNFADKFPNWATESNAMHQYAIWVALQLEGLGCNLQHYNPLINAKVQSTWGLPDSWELKAQMVLGKTTALAKTKTFLPVEDRFTTFGAGYEPK